MDRHCRTLSTNNNSPRSVGSYSNAKQSHLFDFDTSSNILSISNTLITSTQEANIPHNPAYSCRCRRGYSVLSDPFNIWKRQEEPADFSRGDIKRSYRMGGGF